MMARTESPLISLLARILDPMVIVAWMIVVTLGLGYEFTGYYLVLAIIVFFVSSQVLDEFALSRWWLSARYGAYGRDLLAGWAIIVGVIVLIGYASGLTHHYDEDAMLLWMLTTPVILFAVHGATRMILARFRNGAALRSAIIVGANELGVRLADRIGSDPYLFIDVKGFFDARKPERTGDAAKGRLLGHLDTLASYVKANRINLIYISLPMSAQPRILALLEDLKDTTASIYFVPDIFVFDLIQASFDSIGGIPVVAVCESPFTGVNGVMKRLEDIVLSILILALISPIMLMVAIGVKLTSPGPIIFKQRRYGVWGDEILIYKFRSMTVCEDGGDIRQAQKGDQRITPLGAILRRTSLDELPQFVNVLQGRMSIVGPRPHAVAHNEMYRKVIKSYMVRHKVKPGITGWAQVNGLRGETETLDKMEERVRYDLDYLRHWSLSRDVKIIFRTVMVMFKDQAAY